MYLIGSWGGFHPVVSFKIKLGGGVSTLSHIQDNTHDLIHGVADGDLSHMVPQQSPEAEYEQNQTTGGELQCFQDGYCCQDALSSETFVFHTLQQRS